MKLSGYSKVVIQQMLAAAKCPHCHESNAPGKKPLVELTDDGAWCSVCGHEFTVQRPPVEVVG